MSFRLIHTCRMGVPCLVIALGGCAHEPPVTSVSPPVATQPEHQWGEPAVIATWRALGGEGAQPGEAISSTEALAAALNFNPRMTLAHAQVDEGRAGVLVARQRLNPTLSLTPERVLSAVAGASPWVAAISLVWPLQTQGKRSLAIEQALASSDSNLLNAANGIWALRASARAAVCAAEFASRKAALARDELALRKDLASRLEKQATAGLATGYDAARARLERDNAAQRLRQNEADIHSARQDIAAVTGLPAAEVDRRVLGDGCLDSRLVPTGEAVAEISARAITTRLDLRASLAEFRAADAAWRAEVARRKPDLNLGPGYTYDQGDHKITFTVSGELPLYARNDAAIVRAEAERNRVKAGIEVLQQSIFYGVARALDQMRAAEVQQAAAIDATSQAQRLLERDISRYEAGELDQSAVVISRIALVAARSEVLSAQRTLADALTSFEAAAQSPVVPPFFDGPAAQALLALPGSDQKEGVK